MLLKLDGIQGHRDAIIDGALVDVKSGLLSHKRLKDRSIASNDLSAIWFSSMGTLALLVKIIYSSERQSVPLGYR